MSSLNPFAKKQVKLPGKRVAVLKKSDDLTSNLAAASNPIVLPPQRANQDWSQPGGVASNSPGHLAYSATKRPEVAQINRSRRNRDPI